MGEFLLRVRGASVEDIDGGYRGIDWPPVAAEMDDFEERASSRFIPVNPFDFAEEFSTLPRHCDMTADGIFGESPFS